MWIIKKHHTVPCIYLSGFVNKIDKLKYRKSLIHMYDRKNWNFHHIPIEDITVIKNYYTIEDMNWEKTDIIEKIIWNEIESKIWKVIKKINNSEKLNTYDEEILLNFISLQKTRTYADIEWRKKTILKLSKFLFMQKYINGWIEEYKNTLNKIWKFNELSEQEIVDNYNYLIKWEYDAEITSNWYIMWKMIESYEITFNYLKNFKYVIFTAPANKNFITSDDPFYMDAPDENRYMWWVWFLTPWVKIFFPISRTRFIMFSHSSNIIMSWKYVKIDNILLKNLNLFTCNNSYRYILWTNKEQLSKLVKLTNITWIWDFKHWISLPWYRNKE